jgi:glycosyltransferase involved in cell wall biosynthesis
MAGVKGRAPRVIWAYDREHLLHPFIMLGVNTLVDAGWDVTVISSDKAETSRYRSYDAFSFAQRVRNYAYLVHERRKALEAQAVESVLIIKKSRKPLRWEIEKKIKPLKEEERKRLKREIAYHERRHAWLQAVRVVFKAYGNVRRLTWDTWKVYLRAFWRLLRVNGEVMIVSRPESAFWAASIAKLKGMRLVYFSFELFGEQLVKPSGLLKAFERFMLRHMADAVITQNSCRAEVLEKERGARVAPLLVHNYKPIHWDHRPGGKLRAKHALKPGTRVVLYEGMIVDGRWLEYVAQSVLHMPQDVVLVMMGQEKLKWRQVHAEEIRAALGTGRLILTGPVPHDELPDHVADADVGVIIYDDTVRNNLYCEPGKLSDYIAVGVPVVAPNFPTIGPVVRDFDIGRCFDGHSPEAIAATIMGVLERPKEAWSAALKRACSELTWETQAPNLLAAVAGGQASSTSATAAVRGAAVEDLGRPTTATSLQ